MYAGDRISKKTVPGAFEEPRKLYGKPVAARGSHYFCSRLRSIFFA
jgi:hypothetical protein